jgi:hypothetical protein
MNSMFSKLASAASGDSNDQTPEPTEKGHVHHQSSGELFSSAKVVAEAGTDMYRSHSADKVDKPKVAGAAEDLLNAADEYGNLGENKTYGSYVDKAQTYLHTYSHGDSKPATDHHQTSTVKPDADDDQPERDDISESHASRPIGGRTGRREEEDEEEKSGGGGGGGYGGYMKMAQGFLQKD